MGRWTVAFTSSPSYTWPGSTTTGRSSPGGVFDSARSLTAVVGERWTTKSCPTSTPGAPSPSALGPSPTATLGCKSSTARATSLVRHVDRSVDDDRSSVAIEGAAVSGLFYRFTFGRLVEFVCIDTSEEAGFEADRFFDDPEHQLFLSQAFDRSRIDAGRWLIPFGHHPPYCAGPKHHNDEAQTRSLVPRYRESGVQLVLSGHEHNFQHAEREGIHYVVSGAGGKLRHGEPDGLDTPAPRAGPQSRTCCSSRPTPTISACFRSPGSTTAGPVRAAPLWAFLVLWPSGVNTKHDRRLIGLPTNAVA